MADLYNLSDVFVSYSRRDKLFVQRLETRLKADGREVWIDWEDIPETANWWDEIKAGIDAANAFIFVISPDSLESKICRQEIEHAANQGKRFIPLLYRDVKTEDYDVHPAVSSHNWLFCRENDDFDKSYTRLLKVLETDFEHVRSHTRYLVRAREWEGRSRSADYLLVGSDVMEAEVWLGVAGSKEPQPTALQQAYIQASVVEYQTRLREEAERQQRELELQRRSINRLRYLLAGLGVFLVFAVIAAVVLYSLLATQQRFLLNVEKTVERGIDYLGLRQFGAAGAEFTRAVEFEPSFFHANYFRALAFTFDERFEQTLADYDVALAESGQRFELFSAQGVSLAEMFYNRGLALAQSNRPAEAQADFDQALALQPDLVEALNNRGLVLAQQDQNAQALEDFDRALALEPENLLAFNNRRLTLNPQSEQTRTLYRVISEVNLRDAPGVSGQVIRRLNVGEFFDADTSSFREADGFIWWQQAEGWSAERRLDGTQVYMEVVANLSGFAPPITDLVPEAAAATYALPDGGIYTPPPLFERLPLDISYTTYTQYYGNTQAAYDYGSRLGYDRISQGLHSGIDFGTNRQYAPVYAGLSGTVRQIDPRTTNPRVLVQVGDYTVIYQSLNEIAALEVGSTVTPDTVIGGITQERLSSAHLSLDIRYRDRYYVNPLWLMPDQVRDPFLHKFSDYQRQFYRSETWTQWQSPLDQPVLIAGGGLIGPRAPVS